MENEDETIGKSRIFVQEMPPYFLGAADTEKIVFVEYNKVMHIFAKTDYEFHVNRRAIHQVVGRS